MITLEEIFTFIAKEASCDKACLQIDSDIFKLTHLAGDDCLDFVRNFGKEFNVELNSYRWYFHHGGEGWNVGALFVKTPDVCVKRIPITPLVLLESAQVKRWVCQYPNHSLPKSRVDIQINRIILLAVFMLLFFYGCLGYR